MNVFDRARSLELFSLFFATHTYIIMSFLILVLNANMRRIDLCCKLLAPALSGVILQHTDEFSTTIIVAAWNIVSFFAELGLLWVVYRLIPPLAIKKTRHSKASAESDKDDEVSLYVVLHCTYVFVYSGLSGEGFL